MRTRAVLIAVIVAAIATTIATSGVNPAELDRGAAIDVVGDSAANVGYEATCAEGTFSVTITNRFDRPLEDVTVAVNGTSATATPLPMAPGASRSVTFATDDVAPGDAVTVDASAGGVQGVIERAVPGDCESVADLT